MGKVDIYPKNLPVWEKVEMAARRTISIKLDTPNPSVDSFIQILSGTQDAVYAIGRYLEGRPVIGRLHHRVKLPCKLVFKKVTMRSPLEAELAVVPFIAQTHFGEEGAIVKDDDLGEKCVEIFSGYIETVSEEPEKGHDKLHRLVDNPRHRLDIARRVSRMIPEEGAVYVGISDRRRPFKLDPERKEAAHDLVERERIELVSSTEDVRNLVGPIVEARIVDRRYFKIGSTMCLFREEDVTLVEHLLGKVVSLTGKAKTADGRVTEFTEIEDLEVKEEETFSEIIAEREKVALKRPLVASVTYESDLIWIMDSLGLDVSGAGSTWDEALGDFHTQFMVALVGYAPYKDSELTEDAIAIRDKIRRLVPKWKEVIANVTGV